MSLLALGAWTVVVLALAALALPAAAALFPGHPDRGASLALPLAVGTLTLTAYWVGRLSFGPAAVGAGLVVLAAASALAWRRGYRPARRRLRGPLAVFSVAFFGLLAVRYLDPAATPVAGEKFLDYGLLATLLRSDVLPPEDVWFAGESVRYYYGGPLAVALLAGLADVPARYAYNLGLATFYAMLATAVYGLATAVAARHGDRSPRAAGVAAAFLVCVAGRLATPVRLLVGQLPRDIAVRHAGWALAGIRKPPGAVHALLRDPHGWSYWFGRYVVPDALHVFPSWAFLNGDLHAHLLATPFLVLAAALGLAAARETGRRRLLVLGVAGGVAGVLGLTSTWSLPTAAGLAGLAVALAPAHPWPHPRLTAGRVRAAVSRYALASVAALGVALVGVALAGPFLLLRKPDNGGVGVLPPGASLAPLLLAHGVFLALLLWGLARRVSWPALSQRAAFAGGAAVAVGAGAAFALGVDALVVFVPVVALGWYARRRGASDAAVLAVAGAGILLVAEFAYAKVWPHDPNAPRWNTIYKVSMQAFVLWGTAAGVVFARHAARLRGRLAAPSVRVRDVAAAVALVCVVVAAATFPAMALTEHVGGVAEHTNHGLSATAFVADDHPGEAGALRYLRENVSGTPTLVTAPGEPMYTWVSGPASLTGVPTLLGWRHEVGYRGMDAWTDRAHAIESMYEANWPTATVLLDYYDVDYVYVGPVERERYDVRRFAARDGVDIAYRGGSVTIYEVDADAACAATDLRCPPN